MYKVQCTISCIKLLTLQNLFCINFFIPRFDLGLVVQNHVQQGIMDFQFSVVFDETQFAEFVHEKAHPRSGRADHLRQRFLTELSHDRLWPSFLAEICKQKEKPGRLSWRPRLISSTAEGVGAL